MAAMGAGGGADRDGLLPPGVRDFLRAQQATNWSAFPGATLRGVLPITEPLLNTLIREQQRAGSRFAQLRSVSILEDNTLQVHVTIGASLLSKTLSPAVRLEQPSGFPQDPVLTAALPTAYALLLSRWLRGQSASVSALLSIDDHSAQIRLRPLVRQLLGVEVAGLVPLVKHVALRSERGTLFVEFEATAP